MSAYSNPMLARNPSCPTCNQSSPVGKVSAIYVHALEAQHPQAAASGAPDQPPAPKPGFLDGLSRKELIALGERLAPPAEPKKMPTRPLHPDMVVVVFSAILPVFLIGIRSSQPVMLYPIVALLLAGYGLYFWKRRPAIAKYERQVAERQASIDRIRRGLERWMNLFYCSDDDVVFVPGSQEATPADQIAGRLMMD